MEAIKTIYPSEQHLVAFFAPCKWAGALANPDKCTLYPNAKLYFMIDMGLCDYDPNARTFVEDALKIAHRYNIDCIKLYDIHISWNHPDVEGQEDIARQVLEVLESDFNV